METENRPPATAEFRLVVVSDTTIRTYPLQGDRWTIGRGEECDLRLDDLSVSRRHLQLDRDGETFRFLDLGGVNGVLADGRMVRDGELVPGQTLVVGLTRITLDRREQQLLVTADPTQTAVLAREDLIAEADSATASDAPLDPICLGRLLDSIEWAVTDLPTAEDVAEPLLQMALNVTGHRRGAIGLFAPDDRFQSMAAVDRGGSGRELRVPLSILSAARCAKQPFTMTTQSRSGPVQQLLVPLGPGPEGLLLLLDSCRGEPDGQPVLRLARSVGAIAWQRLQETRRRVALQDELDRLRRLVPGGGAPDTLPPLDEVEKLHIQRVLEQMAGNRTRAAAVLGIALSTLYEKIKRYQLDV